MKKKLAVESAAKFLMKKTWQLNQLPNFHIFYYETYFSFRNEEYNERTGAAHKKACKWVSLGFGTLHFEIKNMFHNEKYGNLAVDSAAKFFS